MTIVGADGPETLPLQSKDRVAMAILDRIEKLLAKQSGQRQVRLKPDIATQRH